MKLKMVILADGCGWNSERRTILGSLVGKKFSLGNVMISEKLIKFIGRIYFSFKGVRIWKVREI